MRTSVLLPATLAAVALAALPAAAQQRATKGEASTQAAAAGAGATARVAPALASYVIDATHSELSFRIRHLLGRVSGGFGEWGGTIAIDTVTPANSKVDVTIKTATIDTKNAQRDGHLRSPDFFAADSFPAITFKSRNVVKQGERLRILGDLTIRGRTKPVVLLGEYSGAFKDAQGKPRMAFTASTTINRHDFGVSWNKAVESGSMLGDEVTIDIAVQAVQQ